MRESQHLCSEKPMSPETGVSPTCIGCSQPFSHPAASGPGPFMDAGRDREEQSGILPARGTPKGREAQLTNPSFPREGKSPAISKDFCHPEPLSVFGRLAVLML